MKHDAELRPVKMRVFIATVAMTASVSLLACAAAGGQLLELGQSLALLSVGIMQPEGGAQALSERLDRIPARQGGSDNAANAPVLSYTPGGGWLTSGALGAASANSGDVPVEAGDGGKVTEEFLNVGSAFVQGVAIKNASSRTVDVAAQLKIAPKIAVENIADPQVLIMHTHTTESYMTYFAGYYNASDAARTMDETRSVVAVGEAISAQLRLAGIGVIHDVTVHDSPKYTGAYERSAATVEKILKQYPTIRVVLDIHRDAIIRSDSEKCKPTVIVNGRKAAQMMIITSLGDTKSLPNPHWAENLRFALRLQSTMHNQYPGIVRPLYLVDSRYNQHLTNGSLLIEVGSEANTVSEAVYSGEILGKMLSQVLGTLKKSA